MMSNYYITKFTSHDLAIIIVQNLFFIGLYVIDIDVIHLFVLFEYQCFAHCLNTNIIRLFVLFKHKRCVFIHVVYKLCPSSQKKHTISQ
jgi:hypothetical protein